MDYIVKRLGKGRRAGTGAAPAGFGVAIPGEPDKVRSKDMRAPIPISIALALLAAAGGVRAEPPGAPFITQNENPLCRLYGLPSGDDAAAVAPAGFQMAVALDIANNSFEKAAGADELVLDGETWCARVALRHGWKNGWRVAVQVPVVAHRGGVSDGFIEGYHEAMGLPDGNRKRRPSDRLEYRYRRGDATPFSLMDPATGVGDVRLSVSAPLWRGGAGARAVDAVAGVELPTGDPDRLLGSGSTDFSFGLAACDLASLSRWRLELHGSAGVLALTPGDLMEDWQEPFAGYGNISLGWRLADWLQPRLQVDWHSPFFLGTEMAPLDDWAVELVTGATIFLPRGFMLDIAVAEDIAVNTTPDVVFHFSLKRSL